MVVDILLLIQKFLNKQPILDNFKKTGNIKFINYFIILQKNGKKMIPKKKFNKIKKQINVKSYKYDNN